MTPGARAHVLPESFNSPLRGRLHTADPGLWRLYEHRSRGLSVAQAAGGVSGSCCPRKPGEASPATSQTVGPHKPPSQQPAALRPGRTASRTHDHPARLRGPHRPGPGQGSARGQPDVALQGT